MSLMPRVRARVGNQWDDDDDGCICPTPGLLYHPLVIAAATVCLQVVGELFVRRYTDKGDSAEVEAEIEEPQPKRARRTK